MSTRRSHFRFGRLTILAIAVVFGVGQLGCGAFFPTGDAPFSTIIVFGDSLSDTGNLGAATGLIPAPPYAPGRFSNGEVWIEHVARHYHLPVLPSFLGGTNYAYGGSETGRGFALFAGIQAGPNLLQQIELYPGIPDGAELFVVWAGANDIFNVLDLGSPVTPEEMAANVAVAIATLYGRGARCFLVPNVPDIGLTPKYRGTVQESLATLLTLAYNLSLSVWLDDLDSLNGIRIIRMDVFTAISDALEDPSGPIVNTTDPAWSGFILGYLEGGTLAADPDQHAFWDLVHPTRVSHRLIGEGAIALLESETFTKSPAAVPAFGLPALPPPLAFWLSYLGHLSVGM